LIINAVGSDRLGIVSDMTKYVTDMGGNVGESQAAKLGSHFSLMMLVTVPEAKVDELTSQLSSMTDMNASVYHSTEGKMPTPKIGCKKERNCSVLYCCCCLLGYHH
jgi:glycine cleavage system regulatory protein